MELQKLRGIIKNNKSYEEYIEREIRILIEFEKYKQKDGKVRMFKFYNLYSIKDV